jgi:ketosteroid isomerase-like protein
VGADFTETNVTADTSSVVGAIHPPGAAAIVAYGQAHNPHPEGKIMKRPLVAALLLALGSPVFAAETGELIAVVDLKFLKVTDFVTTWLCVDEYCEPSSHGYLFEARLRTAVNGEWPKKKFLVLYGRHAMGQSNQRRVVGRFSKLTDGPDGAEYQLVEAGVHGQPSCFEWHGLDGRGPAEVPRSGELLRCFDPEHPFTPWGHDLPLTDPEPTLRATNEAYNKALIDGDVVALEQMFADEFTYTSTSGEVLDKAAQLEQFKSDTIDIVSGAGSEESVQIHGSVGIVVGRFDAKGSYAGKPFDSAERYTSVWVVRDGRWQLVAEQGTLVPRKP